MDKILSKDGAVALEKLKIFSKTSTSSQSVNIILALICYMFLENSQNAPFITIWLYGFLVVFLMRIGIFYIRKKSFKNINGKTAIRYLWEFRVGVLINSLMWGIACIILYPYGNIEDIYLFTFIVTTITAGALMVYSIDTISSLIYPSAIIIPLIYKYSSDMKDNVAPLLFGILIYFVFIMINAKYIANDRENYIISTYDLMIKEKEQALQEEQYRLLLNHSPIGIVHYNKKLKISYHNEQFANIMGLDQKDAKLIKLDELKDQKPIQSAKNALSGKMSKYKGFYKTSLSDKVLWIDTISSPVKDKKGNIIGGVSIIQDVTEQKNAEDAIKQLAFYDPLTRLPNRKKFMQKLDKRLELPKDVPYNGALILLDIDGFKLLNDTLGHDIGDIFLQKIAARIKNCVKKSDIVARIGGDEFIILLDGFDISETAVKEAANRIATRILNTISEPYDLLGHNHMTSASIGIVLFGKNSESKKDLIKRADIAMYQAKKTKKNNIEFFVKSMEQEITEEVSLETELQNAIKRQEFILHYQPQVYKDGTIYGAESLVRWQHPEKGMIYPNDFIPTAEKKDLISDIDNLVLEMAIKQISKWKSNPKLNHLTLSINISASHFEEDDFVPHMLSLMDKYKIDASLIKLELTERTILECSDKIIMKMQTLRKRGIKFSLDDFGMGYSSLFYLKKLPIDEIKIDRTFVRDIEHDNNDFAITKTIVAIAKSLEFSFIAEGVETSTQQTMLSKIDCKKFQGYLYSKPILAQDLFDIVEKDKKFIQIAS